MKRRLLRCLLIASLSGIVPAGAAGAGGGAGDGMAGSYMALDYDRRLAGYCGLLTALAQQGFVQQEAELRRSLQLTEEQVRLARIEAILAMDRDWTNYNKAGKAQWCAGAGRAAALRLEGYLPRGGAGSER
ncbi:MAG: hypothetical protein WD489_04475 [Rhodovibrionaceae bacterium]